MVKVCTICKAKVCTAMEHIQVNRSAHIKHFFQNITTLGVGYLTVDTVCSDGMIDFAALDAMPCISESKWVKLIELPKEIIAYIDRSSGTAVVGI